MSRSDNTQPPKFGGRGAFVDTGRKIKGPDPERMSTKAHPRESWTEDREAVNRLQRHKAKEALCQGEEPGPETEKHRHNVQWERW